MNTFSTPFRTEVVRMARKELKLELRSMRKAITSHRSEIAALERDVNDLTSQLKAAQRQTKAVRIAQPSNQPRAAKRTSGDAFFSPEMLAQMRKALGGTQLEMASLLAVSPL